MAATAYGRRLSSESRDGFAESALLFEEALAESLSQGRFRVVIVLDEAPEDLVNLVGYLEEVTDRLVIDLVTVAAYEVGDQKIVVPTRVEPKRFQADKKLPSPPSTPGQAFPGIEEFRKAHASDPPDKRVLMDRASDWAAQLEAHGLAKLETFKGVVASLRVYVPGDMSFVIVNGVSSLQLFGSVFAKRAPAARGRVEELIGKPIGQGTAIYELSDEMRAALTAAYEEAATGRLAVST